MNRIYKIFLDNLSYEYYEWVQYQEMKPDKERIWHFQ